LIPVRPEEIANRVRIELDDSGTLRFEVKGSKLCAKGAGIAAHVEGIGQPMRSLRLFQVGPLRTATYEWLRDRVIANGGVLTVGKGLSASGIGSAFRSMSRRLFPRHKSPPSFYALRHAVCAEMKASGASQETIASAMGHASTLSQKAYGTCNQGRGGYIFNASASSSVRVVVGCSQFPARRSRQPQSSHTRAERPCRHGLG
jgi:integrase